MINKIKQLFTKKAGMSDKDKATARGEAHVKVLEVNFDKDNPGDGYFELEWNNIFVKQLLNLIDHAFLLMCYYYKTS